ncbi:MAG: energy transducer TonB, partial [Pseudomonadota bacterium]
TIATTNSIATAPLAGKSTLMRCKKDIKINRPPPPKLTVQNNDKPPPDIPDIKTPNVDIAVAGDGVYLGGFDAGNPGQDGDVIPIVRIEPQYPRDAAMNGIEGWVDVAILIAADGSVKNVDVVDSDPRRVFDKAARRAVYKWKFKPRVVDGQAVERTANTRLNFSLGQQ